MSHNAVVTSLTSANRSYWDGLVSILIFFVIFFPSSIAADFYRLDVAVFGFFIFNFLCLILYFRYFQLSFTAIIIFLCLVVILLFNTVISGYSEYAFGYSLSLFPMLILGLFRINRAPSFNLVLGLYYSVVVFIFFFAYLGFFFSGIRDVIIAFYSGGYLGLSERFLETFSPVSIFISHSYAGFFYFLILFSSKYLAYTGVLRNFNFVIIIICLISMLLLKSGSSYFFFLYSLIFLSATSILSIKNSKVMLFVFIFLLMILTGLVYFSIDYFLLLIERIVGDGGNGLLSRYGDGVLRVNIDYILNNPFLGIGFSYSSDFYYTDSDYVVSFLRFGFFGFSIYYIYLFLLLRRFIGVFVGRIYFAFFVGAFLCFMISMPVFSFYRTAPLLVLLVLLFSSLAYRGPRH
ncbi:hypothetical protein [Stutzerimonas stutzeri]|uniref:hypothetical protein n=1 Tax=Stutzerimonas stutzeri TaxID=316 RepID=UPI000F7A57B3|nr:hypothetical protein [Stutzerimonas stutzeri]